MCVYIYIYVFLFIQIHSLIYLYLFLKKEGLSIYGKILGDPQIFQQSDFQTVGVGKGSTFYCT